MPSASASHGWFILRSAGPGKRSRQRKMRETFVIRGSQFATLVLTLFRRSLFAVCLLGLALACDHEKDAAPVTASSLAPSSHGDPSVLKVSFPADSGPPPTFDGARAMQYVKEIVAFGPRPIGSANHKKVEDYILGHLKGDTIEGDAFTADTP